jgi:hypothetical protein
VKPGRTPMISTPKLFGGASEKTLRAIPFMPGRKSPTGRIALLPVADRAEMTLVFS